MFAFEEQDGVDVCFFGMHVQVCYEIFCIVLKCFLLRNIFLIMYYKHILFRSTEVNVHSLIPEEFTLPTLIPFISSNQETLEQQFIMKSY